MYFYMYICMYVYDVCIWACACHSMPVEGQSNLRELLLSFYLIGPRIELRSLGSVAGAFPC